jgi:hypothetical protein
MKTVRAQRLWFVAAVALGICRHYQGDDISGLVVLGFWAFLYLDHHISVLAQAADPGARTPTNCYLDCDVGIDRVLAHSEVERLFGLLKAKSLIDAPTVDAWRAQLLANWQQVTKTTNLHDTVNIHARGDVLVINDKLAPRADWIHYQIRIPYNLDENTGKFRYPSIHHELEIRLVAVNGVLKLQIGHFNQEFSPHIFSPGPAIAKYQTYTTVSSFPLMYCAGEFAFPVSTIGLSFYAAESYKELLVERSKRTRKKRGDDWQAVMADVRIYKLLCDSSNDVDVSPTDAEIAAFAKKRDEMLKENGFTDLYPDKTEGWRYPHTGTQYGSQLMNLSVQNLNLMREYQARNWVVDYQEDMP